MCALKWKRLKITDLPDTTEVIKHHLKGVECLPDWQTLAITSLKILAYGVWRWKTPVIKGLHKLGKIDKRESHEGKQGAYEI